MDFPAFQVQAVEFLEKLFSDMAVHDIQIPAHWPIDHLCYRVDSIARYEALKKDFAAFGSLLIESDVNGRPIATFKLDTPITSSRGSIALVELPAPKPSKPTKEGFEHIEIVCDVPLSDLEKRYGHLNLDRGGMKKEINPELEIVLGDRNLKFHNQSLEDVIALELAIALKGHTL